MLEGKQTQKPDLLVETWSTEYHKVCRRTRTGVVQVDRTLHRRFLGPEYLTWSPKDASSYAEGMLTWPAMKCPASCSTSLKENWKWHSR